MAAAWHSIRHVALSPPLRHGGEPEHETSFRHTDILRLRIPSGDGMAKKGYPGLVLVPPSDRTIFRRRLFRWGLIVIALIWCASILPLWHPASEDKTDCRPGVEQQGSDGSVEKCGPPQSVTEPPPNQSEFSLTRVSQAEGLAEPQNSAPSAASDSDPPAIQNNQDQGSKLKSFDPTHRPSDHNVAPQSTVKSASSPPPSKPAQNPEIDVRITDRLATPHNHSQDSKPKSIEPAARPVDHNFAPSGNERSDSNLPPPKPIQPPDVDARLAEQGDAFAQYRLGRYYAQRDGSRTPEAVGWYRKAAAGLHRLAETGNGQAMYVLGVMYAYGRGVQRDTEQARRWLTQAVENKVTAAKPVLASLNGVQNGAPKPQVSDQPSKNAKP